MGNNSKIKLLLIVPTLAAGGSEKVISTIANTISKEKFEVTLLVIDSNYNHFQVDSSVNVIFLNKQRVSHSIFEILRISRLNDVIISTLTHLNIIVSLLKFTFLRSKIIIARESIILSINNKYQSHPRTFNLLIRWFYPFFDGIICQSIDMKNDMVKNFALNSSLITVINNPTKTTTFIPNSHKKSPPINFLTVARLVKQKGLDRIIRSLSSLDFDFIYNIVGDGDQFKNLRRLVEELNLSQKVIFHGTKNSQEFYEKADFYLFGSYVEGFPNVLIEAASYGIPIVAFNCPGGVNEIINQMENGIVVDSESEDEFANAITTIISSNLNRELIQKNNQKRFDLSIIIPKYEQLILSLYSAKT